ncbi:YggT family protein [Chloroflexales bacterium ZM16-3]|nr:YggT family protein [Chloroflexales bacterium ZM16-3]
MQVRGAILAWLAGAVEALLLARLLARLLAARPDSPAFAALYAVTWPLVAPLSALDVTQRQFGAVLELSTLATAIIVPVGASLLWAWLATRSVRRSSYGTERNR